MLYASQKFKRCAEEYGLMSKATYPRYPRANV